MADIGVVNTIDPPKLSDVKQSAIIKFEVEYVAYKERVENVNRTRPTNGRISAASVRQCIDPFLLNSLCILGEIENASNLEEATDAAVRNWFDARLSSAPVDMTERIRSALESVVYKTDRKDPAGGVLSFIINVVSALDKNNASEIIQDKETCKSLIQKLVTKLEPAELRERVKDAKDCWTVEQKSNLNFFKERVSSLAVDVNQGEIVRARLHRHGLKRNRQPSDVKDQNEGKSTKQKKYKNSSSSNRNSGNTAASGSEKKGKWKYPCINPDCPEKHPFKECKNTPESDRQALWDSWTEKMKAKRAKKLSAVIFDGKITIPNPEEGRYSVILEDTINTTALGDTGADESAMSHHLVSKIKEASQSVEITPIVPPVKLQVAIRDNNDDHSCFTASSVIKVSILIILPGSRLPLRLHGVPFYVVDQQMNEVILGRSFLQKIGFNLDNHLTKVSSRINGKQFEHLNEDEVKISAINYSGMQYNSVADDPIELPPTVGASFGEDNPEEITAAFEDMIKEAKANGITEAGAQQLRKMLLQYRSVFCIKLGADPPADVLPLQVHLIDKPRPYRAPQRRYAPRQRNFIISTVQRLESIGAIYKNPHSRWASPALAVIKPGSEELRFTVDLRGPNSQTQPIVSAMPHLESMLSSIEGSQVFSKVDMAHAYWQLPLSEDSQEILSIQTPLGVYSSNRVLQGSTDAGNHFQAVTQEKFTTLDDNKLQWMDDFLLHADSQHNLLDVFENFLKVCNHNGFKIHAKKTSPFLKQAKFCGRLISKDGVQFDPRNFAAISKMPKPRQGGELQQLLCATNWMRASIPSYSELVAPLHNLMEQVYKLKGSRTKRSVKKFPLTGLWGTEHDHAFTALIENIVHSTKLAFLKKDHSVCLFTDASETHWASMLTQLPTTEMKLSLEKQNHEPLAFLSGSFTGSSSRWSIPEKEGFAIVESMTRLEHLTVGRVVSIFTDHATLVYLFDPIGQNPGIARHTASKLMRWALRLSSYSYVIEHISGDKNVWADMLTRWAAPSNQTVCSMRIKSMIFAPISPHLETTYDWPKMRDVRESQQASSEAAPRRFTQQNGLYIDSKHVYWIPSNDDQMKTRILVAGHAGIAGHRGISTTKEGIVQHFWWKNCHDDIESFVKSCLHCLLTASNDIIPRPLGHALHASRPNEIIHFDFCYIMQGEQDQAYVLVIKDDFSGYVWLLPAKNADSSTTADGLLTWFSSFGVVPQWVSDQGTHFKNEVIRHLLEQMNSSHHFTLPYTPWSNGTVEVVGRELLRCIRALLSEFQLPQRSWTRVLPLVQSALNSSILKRLGGR